MKNRIKIFSFILTGMLILGPFLSCSGAVSPDGHDEEPAEQPSNTGTNKPSAVTNFTVTFNSDGGTAITPQTVRKGSLATRPADPQKEGYIFLGWFISDDLYDFSTPVNSNITLTAKWELPDLEDIYITSSTQDIVQTIKDYEQPEDAEHPDTINIYVIGQMDQTKLIQINTGIIEWAEGYYEKNSENPSLKINLDLQYSTGITELNSNSITLGKTSYEAELKYLVKLSPHTSYIATDALTGLNSSKIKFLIDERTAKQKLLTTKVGQNMTTEARSDYLRPFSLTTSLREEIMNLREENEGLNIILKQANKSIKKDKFSALEYGLYYIKKVEEDKKKKKFRAADWMFMN